MLSCFAEAKAMLCVGVSLLGANVLGQDMVIGERPHNVDNVQLSLLIEKLGSDQFGERERALRELLELPLSALPWAEDKLRQLKGNENLEVQGRFASVVASLRKQRADWPLSHGTQVVVDLTEVTAAEALAEIEKQTGGTLGSDSWRWGSEIKRADFSFKGAFWEAIDALALAQPPLEGEIPRATSIKRGK